MATAALVSIFPVVEEGSLDIRQQAPAAMALRNQVEGASAPRSSPGSGSTCSMSKAVLTPRAL